MLLISANESTKVYKLCNTISMISWFTSTLNHNTVAGTLTSNKYMLNRNRNLAKKAAECKSLSSIQFFKCQITSWLYIMSGAYNSELA